MHGAVPGVRVRVSHHSNLISHPLFKLFTVHYCMIAPAREFHGTQAGRRHCSFEASHVLEVAVTVTVAVIRHGASGAQPGPNSEGL